VNSFWPQPSFLLHALKRYIMQRYNPFVLIHKGLKASLFQTALCIQQTDFTSSAAEETIMRLQEVLVLFRDHQRKIKNYYLPVISEFEPAVCTLLLSEEEKGKGIEKHLLQAVEKLMLPQPAAIRLSLAEKLSASFGSFISFWLDHMHRIEEQVNHIAWRHYTDEEIINLSGKASLDSPPWIDDFYAGWILQGINDTEVVQWMSAVKQTMPPPLFQTLVQKAEKFFPRHRLHRIRQSLATRERVMKN
jgi:hypothetical protein